MRRRASGPKRCGITWCASGRPRATKWRGPTEHRQPCRAILEPADRAADHVDTLARRALHENLPARVPASVRDQLAEVPIKREARAAESARSAASRTPSSGGYDIVAEQPRPVPARMRPKRCRNCLCRARSGKRRRGFRRAHGTVRRALARGARQPAALAFREYDARHVTR